MAVDFLVIDGNPSQSNGVGTATSTATGGSAQDTDGSDARRFAAIAACTYYQKSADTPVAIGAQTYNTNIGPTPMAPYAASGNNIGSAYPVAYLLLKHQLCANPMYAVHAVGSTGLLTHWDKASGTSHYADGVAFCNARVAEAGRNIDVYISKFNETDANSPAAITNFSSRWAAHFTNLKADIPGLTANTLFVMVLVNPNAVLGGDGDVAGMRAAQIAFVNANPQWIGVDPYVIPVAADPHYKPGGYWSLGEVILNAIRARKFPANRIDLGVGPSPWVQADGAMATTQNNTTTLRPRGARGHVGELAARNDYQLAAVAGYTGGTTHTVVTPAGLALVTTPAVPCTAGQVVIPTDSVFSTNHRTLSVYGRSVIDSAMSSDAFGRRVMPTPAVRVDSSTLNIGQIATIANVHPTNPIQGSYFGTNDANTTTLLIPKVAPGSPLAVIPGTLAFAYIAENGATQTIVSITNPDTGPWTIHRDQVINPGAGSVGLALASAVCTGTQLRQTTVTYGLAGVNVGAVIAMTPLITGDAVATCGAATASAAGTAIDAATATASCAAATAGSTGTLVVLAAATATAPACSAAATAIQAYAAAALATCPAAIASAAGGQSIFATAQATAGAAQAFAGAVLVHQLEVLYSTVDDAINAIGGEALRQLSDLDNRGVIDNSRVIAAIKVADGIINSYLGKRYAVPLAIVPQPIATLSCDWAIRVLRTRAYKIQPLAEDSEADEVARAWLAGIAGGTISIGVDARPPKASDRVDVGQAPRESSRHMSLRRMKGFI